MSAQGAGGDAGMCGWFNTLIVPSAMPRSSSADSHSRPDQVQLGIPGYCKGMNKPIGLAC